MLCGLLQLGDQKSSSSFNAGLELAYGAETVPVFIFLVTIRLLMSIEIEVLRSGVQIRRSSYPFLRRNLLQMGGIYYRSCVDFLYCK